METKSIEEGAKAAFPNYCGINGEKLTYDTGQMRAAYSLGAQEERGRCIEAAQKWWCKNHCSNYRRCINGLGNTHILASECADKSELCKAIEEGYNYDSI